MSRLETVRILIRSRINARNDTILSAQRREDEGFTQAARHIRRSVEVLDAEIDAMKLTYYLIAQKPFTQ